EGELVRRPRESTLLELTRHGDQPLAAGGAILASCAPAPRVGTGTAVGEHPAGQHEAVLILRSQLGQRLHALLLEQPLRKLELRLDIGLVRAGTDESGVALRAEEEADCLGEDRLSRPGLAGDRVQARPGREVGLSNENEVLDAEPTKQRSLCTAGRRSTPEGGRAGFAPRPVG